MHGMKKGEDKRQEFEYSKTIFVQKVLLEVVILLMILLLFGTQLPVPLPWLALIILLLLIHILIFGISPLFTNHWLTRTRLILRQGWYFKAIIPISNIECIDITDEKGKLGAKFSLLNRTVYVTSSKFDLLSLKLKEAMRFPFVLGIKSKEVVFNVEDKDKFLSLLKERMESLSPI